MSRVKRSENGVIVNPFFLSPENTVRDADELMGKYKISGVPICKDGKLVGIFESELELLNILLRKSKTRGNA